MSLSIIDFYKGILSSTSLVVKENGDVDLDLGDGYKEPFFVNLGRNQSKRLVLPTDEVLRNPNWDATVAFHPLSENIARKDSAVFKSFQSLVNVSLNSDIGYIMKTMLDYCADSDSQANLNHRQTEFLSRYPNADAQAVKNFDKIENAISGGPDIQYIKVYTLRDKKLNNESFPRVAFVKFPFYESLCEQLENGAKTPTVFGVKLRKKDLEGFKQLFEFIFKGHDLTKDPFSLGSRSVIAPSFHALASVFYNVKQELTKRYKLLKIDGMPPLTWGEVLNDLNQYKGRIPPLAGNEGDVTEGERRRNETAITTPQTEVKTAPVLEPPKLQASRLQPVAAPTPVASAPVNQPTLPGNVPGKREMKTIDPPMLNTQPQYGYQQQPVAGQPIVGQPMMQPMMAPPAGQPVYGQPVYGQPVMQPGMYPQYAYQQPVDRNGRPVTNMGYQTATPAMQATPYIQPTGNTYNPTPVYYQQPQPVYQPAQQPMYQGYPPRRY